MIILGVPLALLWGLDEILGAYLGLNYFEQFWADFVALVLLFFISVEALARILAPFPKMAAQSDESDHLQISPASDPSRDWSNEAQQLKSAVVENAWHLETSLSLKDLSLRMGTNQAYLSRTLNQGLGMSFSHFINGLRVEHAEALIRAGQPSMLAIAIESGFGSKASFNRAFKLHTGKTPTQYAKSLTGEDAARLNS